MYVTRIFSDFPIETKTTYEVDFKSIKRTYYLSVNWRILGIIQFWNMDMKTDLMQSTNLLLSPNNLMFSWTFWIFKLLIFHGIAFAIALDLDFTFLLVIYECCTPIV